MNKLQIEMTLAALVLLFLILFALKRSHMSIKISLAWLLLPIIFIIIAIFPDPFANFASWLGFETLANFLFVVIIAAMLIVIFALTLSLSHQQAKITKLAQEISLLKKSQTNNPSPKSSPQKTEK